MPQDSAKMQILKEEVTALLQKHAIEEVKTCHPRRGFFSRIFLVKKRSGGWRPVIDLSRLNKFVLCPHFKMETLDTVRMSLQKGDWATSLDLRDAYFHIPIHQKSHRYLRFFFKGKIYQFRALPFGLSVSPYVFSRVLKAVLRHVRRLGIRVHAYLDDWLQLSVSEVQSWQHSRRLLNIILELGFVPNWEKSELVPTQKFCFLGARFNLIKGQVGPSLERISTFQQALTLLLNARQASAHQLHSIVGQMESMANLLPWGRLHKRSLQWGIKERWSQEDCLWEQQIHYPPPDFQLFTDSRLDGWGAHLDSHMASGIWPVEWKGQHINVLELRAVFLALQAFTVHVQSRSILLATDNKTVAAHIHKQGGDSFQDPVQSDNAGCIVVCRAQGSPEGTVPPREIEHLGRLPFKENESCSDRVVIEPESGRSDLLAMELSSNRSLCYSAEQEVSSVCVTCSRPRGICSGCSFDQLERDVSICVSSISSDITMSQEDTDRGVLSLVNCSSLGGTTLVSSPTIITGCSSTTASSESRSVVSTGISDVTSHARHLSSSRLFAMQQQMEASGISRAVAQRIYSSKRSSTNNMYDYRWKSWVDWCIGRQMDPCNPTINGFAEFLIFLHNENFCPATMKGYRSAISTTLKQISKIDFSNESVLSDVVKSFELERPRLRSHFPKWDLTLVLSSLLAPPYEPLEYCGFKELTLKTVFLIAFASGRRRSDVHAFSVTDVQFSDQSVTLFTFPGFLAKNQLPSVLSPAICIPALKGQGDTPLLCPVRALRIYLTRVFPRRKNRKRVFISHLENYPKEISSDTVSRWIVQTIRFAYEGSSLELPKVNAHEVRALASSWAWFNKVALEDILRASYWSSENSFIRFYLRDISTLSRSLARLGPMVAAQSVIVPSTISSVWLI